MDRQRWFTFLKPQDRPDGAVKPALLDMEVPEAKTLIVCQEIKNRHFAKFQNYLEYATYFLKHCQDMNRCFYELIFAELPQKPYFDLDIPLPRPEGKCVLVSEALKMDGVPRLQKVEQVPQKVPEKPLFTLSPKEAEEAVIRLEETIRKVCPQIKPSDIMRFSSHGPKKRSYHVVVDNWCFPDSNDNRCFHNTVMALFPEKWRDAIDHTMYKSTQQFRIYLCHKYQSDRVKILDKLSTWRPPVKSENNDHAFVQILGASLINNSSYCRLLPSFKPLEPAKTPYSGEEMELQTSEIEKVVELGGDFFKSFPFKLKSVKGGMIMLNRTRPASCDICKRVHDNEHAYMTVSGSQRHVYFYCRRADKKDRVHVGSLGFDFDQPVSQPFLDIDVPSLPDDDMKVSKAIASTTRTVKVPATKTGPSGFDLITTMHSLQPTSKTQPRTETVSIAIEWSKSKDAPDLSSTHTCPASPFRGMEKPPPPPSLTSYC
jgi:hypothetical protein